MHNLFKKITALVASSVCMLTFVGISSHGDTKIANAATNGDVFTLANDPSKLQDGQEIIFVGLKTPKNKPVEPFIMGDISGTFFNANPISVNPVSNESYTFDSNDNPAVFTLKKIGTDFIFEFNDGGTTKYINSTTEKKVDLSTTISDTSKWNITKLSGDTTGNLDIKCKTTSNGSFRFNSSNPRFTTYNSNQARVYIFSRSVNLIPQQLTFDHNDGTPATPEKDTYTKIPDLNSYVLPDKDNQYFDGWYYDKTNQTEATKVSTNDSLSKATTVYAKWTDFKKVTFHYEDGVTQDVTIEKLRNGSTIDPSKVVVGERKNFEFRGWTIGKGGPEFSFANEKNPTLIDSNIDVYANWAEGFKVYYKIADSKPNFRTVYDGNRASDERFDSKVPADKLFIHWYEEGTDSSVPFDFKTPITKETTLVAKLATKADLTLNAVDGKTININENFILEATITGDATPIDWFVVNDENAIKYTEEGNKLNISGYKAGDVIISATVQDALGTPIEKMITLSVRPIEAQKIDTANIGNLLGAKFSSVEKEMFKQVTSLDELTTGEYYIGSESVIANSTVSSGDKEIGMISYTSMNDEIESLRASSFTITVKEGQNTSEKQITLQAKDSNLYIGKNSDKSNDKNIKTFESEVLLNASFDKDGNFVLKANAKNNPYLRYNGNNNCYYFKFYGSGSCSAIQLYKLGTGAVTDYTEVRTRLAINLDKAFIDANNSKGFKLNTEVTMPNGNVIEKELTSYIQNEDGSRTYVLAIRFTKPENGDMNFAAFNKDIFVKPYLTFGENADKYYFYDNTVSQSPFEELRYNISVKNVIDSYLSEQNAGLTTEDQKVILRDLQSKIK